MPRSRSCRGGARVGGCAQLGRLPQSPVVWWGCPAGWMCLAGAPMAIMCSSASGGAEKMPHRPGRLSHDRHPRPNTSTHPGRGVAGPAVFGVVGWQARPPTRAVGWPGRRFRGWLAGQARPPTRAVGSPGRRFRGWLAGQALFSHPGIYSPGRRFGVSACVEDRPWEPAHLLPIGARAAPESTQAPPTDETAAPPGVVHSPRGPPKSIQPGATDKRGSAEPSCPQGRGSPRGQANRQPPTEEAALPGLSPGRAGRGGVSPRRR
ncbi:hypothetical protein DFQ13_103557 [Actinokineospora spheciospongiae]|nr:hypothetical protein DFQ13_103557 [Actinokineospora spheciospongiae]